jgi:hypothetical protein
MQNLLNECDIAAWRYIAAYAERVLSFRLRSASAAKAFRFLNSVRPVALQSWTMSMTLIRKACKTHRIKLRLVVTQQLGGTSVLYQSPTIHHCNELGSQVMQQAHLEPDQNR